MSTENFNKEWGGGASGKIHPYSIKTDRGDIYFGLTT
jgi:hypothetical protein